MHYGDPPIMTALRQEICDVLIIGYGATNIVQQAAVAAMANIPFWLQYVEQASPLPTHCTLPPY